MSACVTCVSQASVEMSAADCQQHTWEPYNPGLYALNNCVFQTLLHAPKCFHTLL